MSHDRDFHQRNDGDRGPSPFLIGLIIVGVLAVIFVLQNTNSAQVEFLFFDGSAKVWVVILVSIIAGMLLDRLLQLWMRRRKERR
jgi:uncharacterized integral membrane protein